MPTLLKSILEPQHCITLTVQQMEKNTPLEIIVKITRLKNLTYCNYRFNMSGVTSDTNIMTQNIQHFAISFYVLYY